MELNFDWRSFQSLFYPQRRSNVPQNSDISKPIFLVLEGNTVLTAFSESEDLSKWSGLPCSDIATEFSHREFVLFDRASVDKRIQEGLAFPHFYEQVEDLLNKCSSQIISGEKLKKGSKPAQATQIGMGNLINRHFLLEALQGWWSKVLPSAYGIYVRLEGHSKQDLFVLVRRGRVECFNEPDLSTLGEERRRKAGDVVKYLSEKHLVPVQGIFVPAHEWLDWSSNFSQNPWRKITQSLKSNRTKLVPFRWSLVSLMASKAFLK